MKRDEAITRLQRHEAELKKLGVLRLAIFGSTARDDADDVSDIDVEVKLTEGPRGFARIERLEVLRDALVEILGRPVDVITDTTGSPRVRRSVARERVYAF